MLLCDVIMEDQVACHKEYSNIRQTRNIIRLLQVIKQLMYSHGSEEIHVLTKKDPFPKNVSHTCWHLDGLQINYGGWSIQTEADDVI